VFVELRMAISLGLDDFRRINTDFKSFQNDERLKRLRVGKK